MTASRVLDLLAFGAIFGCVQLATKGQIKDGLRVGQADDGWSGSAHGRRETRGIRGARARVKIWAKIGAVYADRVQRHRVLHSRESDLAAVLKSEGDRLAESELIRILRTSEPWRKSSSEERKSGEYWE